VNCAAVSFLKTHALSMEPNF